MAVIRYLPLTFPPGPNPVSIGCAGGTRLRYEVRHVGHAEWELEIVADGLMRTRAFKSERAAKRYARDDFMRRQLIQRAA